MKLGTPVATGNTADIYLYGDRIVKVFKDYLPETEAKKEAEKQKHAYSWGLPVPEVFEITTMNNKQALIMEAINGETLGDLFYKNKEKSREYLEISVDIQVKIHSIIPKQGAIESMEEKLARQIDFAAQLKPEEKICLKQKLASFRYEKRLCLGDFHLFNLIQSEDKVTVIDWVDSTEGDRRADVCRTYLLYSQVSEEWADDYLAIYCRKSDLTRAEIIQWMPVIAGARLSEHMPAEDAKRLLAIVKLFTD